MVKDYYRIMGLPKTATPTDVKKAYHALALKYHPDKNKSPNAEELFKELGEAYQVLSDPTQRQAYNAQLDQSRRTGLHQAGTYSPYTYWSNFSNAYDFFTPNPQPQMKPAPRISELEMTLEDVYSGATKRVVIKRLLCNMQVEKEFVIHIKPGSLGGKTITLRGDGDYIFGLPRGDIVFVLREKPHAVFSRMGNDLKAIVKIAKNATMLGILVPIPTIHKTVKLLDTHGIKHMDQKRLVGFGLPLYGQPYMRGDMICEFHVI